MFRYELFMGAKKKPYVPMWLNYGCYYKRSPILAYKA